MPIGKRPRPRVARNHSPKFNTNNTGRAPGVSSSKSPTGSRPRPKVAKNSTPVPSVNPPTRKGIRRFPMPAPKTRWAKRGGGKAHGGS